MKKIKEQIKSLIKKESIYEADKRNLNEDHLKEGIGSYIYTKAPKKINPNIFVNKKKYSKIKYSSNAYYITQRVLYPEKDILKTKPCTKRILSTEKKIKYDDKNGIFKSFIYKTPCRFPVKNMKNLNSSYDYAKKEHDIFLRNKFEESENGRIFGVERKRINKNHNDESAIPKYKFNRRFFFEKAKNMDNIYL